MINRLLKHLSKLTLLFIFIGFIPNISFAATTDCIQYNTGGAPGTVNCQKAVSTWTLGGGSPLYSKFEELRPSAIAALCGSYGSTYECYEQEGSTTPPIPVGKTCGRSPTCSVYTETYDTTSNTGGRYAVTYYPIGSSSYFQSYLLVYHFRTCPLNTTSVTPNATSLVLCKPDVPQTLGSSCTASNSKLSCDEKAKGKSTVGEPVDIGSGSKTIVDTDFIYNSTYPFLMKRYYSQINNNWQHEYSRQISYSNTADGEFIVVSRQTYQTISFKKVSGVWTEINSSFGTKLVQVGNDIIYTNENDQLEFYTNLTSSFDNLTLFALTSIEYSGGGIFLLSYSADGLLNKVTDPFNNIFLIGMSRGFSGCNNLEKITSFTDPSSNVITYQYDGSCQMTKAIYSDTTYKEYSYGSRGVIYVSDENGDVNEITTYSTVTGRGTVASSEGSGSSGNINKTSLDYNTANQVTLRDSLTNSITVDLFGINNNYQITGYSMFCSYCSGVQGTSLSYYSNGYLNSITDFNSIIKTYTYTP